MIDFTSRAELTSLQSLRPSTQNSVLVDVQVFEGVLWLGLCLTGVALAPFALYSASRSFDPAGLPYIAPEGRLDVGDIYKQVELWKSQGQVARDADPKSFVDLSFVRGHFNVPG